MQISVFDSHDTSLILAVHSTQILSIHDRIEDICPLYYILKHLREFVQSDWFLPVLYPTIEKRRAARLECLHLAGLIQLSYYDTFVGQLLHNKTNVKE